MSKLKLFISYRRDDSADVTGRIYDRLAKRHGGEHVFKDVDSIPFGVDFKEHLDRMVGECHVFLAVIGPEWTGGDERGRRLDDPSDFVRIEVESALRRDIPVVPILVRGAAIPARNELPESLQPLVTRNGVEVRPDPDFHKDMDRLIEGLARNEQLARFGSDNRDPQRQAARDARERYGMAIIHGAAGKLEEAIEAFQQAAALDPDYALAHLGLASALTDQGRLDDAVAAYRAALERDPTYPVGHVGLGAALSRLRNYGGAIEAFREAIRLDPQDAEAYEGLGTALGQRARGEDQTEAEGALTRARELHTGSPVGRKS